MSVHRIISEYKKFIDVQTYGLTHSSKTVTLQLENYCLPNHLSRVKRIARRISILSDISVLI